MPLASELERILESGVKAVIPSRLIDQTVTALPNGIKISGSTFTYSGRLNVFGFGKAAMGLVRQTTKILDSRVDAVVCCIPQPTDRELADSPELFSDADIKSASRTKSKVFTFYGPRTNEPNEEVVKSSLKMAKIAAEMEAGDLLLVCISGGGSALLTLPSPIDPTVSPCNFSAKRLSLDAIVRTSKLLSLEGAAIQELNSVRSCLDCMKAGGLARFAAPAQVVGLILSDVIGDPIRFIASGPTYVETESLNGVSPFDSALSTLDKYGLRDKIPVEVKNFLMLRRGTGTNPSVVEPRPVNHIIGSLSMALEAAAHDAAKVNPSCLPLNSTVLQQDIFRRTPVESFECILPIILTDAINGDMTERAIAIADLSWGLRRLIQVFLKKPECTSRHVTEMMGDRLKAAQKRVTGRKEYYRDLVHACYLVAKVASGQLPLEGISRGRFLSGVCLLLGGEATVKVVGERAQSINGGRCSHAALTAGVHWFDLRTDQSSPSPPPPHPPVSVHISLFARASDGLDGPTAFGAGAWSTEEMIRDAEEAKMARQCLASGDSYGFFVRSQVDADRGHFLPARLTGTNVMDLFMCLIGVYA
ncbi:Glycerate kinase [Echinococcus granulosus]|uniref:Glycerate kinase n=1 Tax=Echinococcus granulosus TaxID=6210 RepID=U6J4D4_ECHGR|nr:Glycerate kinase [Echinococcus granulosus]EUB64558.1 Glycerate kinase [Echinococcus granulosus]KAH9286834.1 Glycerate kinase [Echinococcus granulosus]CDS16588.1 glycerate kinase [Echinococcus granulosus]